jgi:hypothetical protein
MRKSQTATEYLIILAVVVVIALIVVGVMGGIPSIGGGASAATSKASLQSDSIRVVDYQVGPYYSLLELQNIKSEIISISSITIDDKECYIDKSPVQIKSGEVKKM